MVAGEIVVDREQALSAVEGYDSEARELKAINDLIAAVSSALEGAWEGRARPTPWRRSQRRRPI